MSETDGDGITVSGDGITVRKTVTTDQFKTPAVVFDVRSSRSETETIVVSDEIPTSIPSEDVGFHPAYGGEHWSIEGDSVRFQRSFEPDEEYTTVYGVRGVESETLDELMENDPTIDLLEERSGTDDIDSLVAGGNDLVRDVIKGERDNLPGLGEDDSAASPSDPSGEAADPAFDLGDESADDEAPEIAASGSEPRDFDDIAADVVSETEEEPDDETPLVPGDEAEEAEADEDHFDPVDDVEEETDEDPLADVGTEVAADAEAEEGSEEEPGVAKVLEDALDEADAVADEVGASPELDERDERPDRADGSVDEGEPASPEDEEEITVPASGGVARVLAKEFRAGNVSPEDRKLLREELALAEGSLAARIEHLQSRTSDLEAYTDALEAFLDRHGEPDDAFQDVHESIEAVESETAELSETVASVEDTVSTLEESVDGVTDEMADVSDEVLALADELETTDRRVDAAVGSVDDLDDRLARVSEDVSDLESELADVQGSVEGDVDDLQSEVETIRHRLDDVEGVDEEVAALREEVEDMAAFKEQLSTAFGGTDEE